MGLVLVIGVFLALVVGALVIGTDLPVRQSVAAGVVIGVFWIGVVWYAGSDNSSAGGSADLCPQSGPQSERPC